MIDPKYKIESEDFEKFGIRRTHTITRIDVNGHRRVLKVFFGHDGKARANKLVELLEKNDTFGDDTKLRKSEQRLYFKVGVLTGIGIGIAAVMGILFLSEVFA